MIMKRPIPWWNDTVKTAVKEMKMLFKQWSASKSQEDYDGYIEARHICKKVTNMAKTWLQNLPIPPENSSRQ